MITAQQLRPGMAIRFEGANYKVLSCEYHPGQGKMGGVAHVRLKNLSTGTFREQSLRADLKLDTLPVEKQNMEFIYTDAGQCYFMNPATFEQIGIDEAVVGAASRFLQPGMQLPVEFIEGLPASVVFPDIVEMCVGETSPPVHGQQDSTWKPAKLDNGITVLVPQFIKNGDMIRIDIASLKYVDRARVGAR
jgi:elongation factor P